MIQISDSAQRHFLKLIAAQGGDGLGIRLRVRDAGMPAADCELEFCSPEERREDDWTVECGGFAFYIDAESVRWLKDASIDYKSQPTGGELIVHAPAIRGSEPAADAPLALRVQHLLDAEINPQLAAHGGRVQLESMGADNAVVLRFGGGCQGCGMADVTLKQGVEKTLRARFPEISAVLDATDHASGHTPFYRGHEGRSAVG
ncbi:MAG: NfuA family Fe-S biogenesis protein [Pseudomonadota bacterium]|nr:NfuA family Fe-S biogenesis protein [Pseudomonadota bacterium]